jgi:alkyl sulfatase BDS1-like metallo-beta-lactamase superfamily hydrolase
MELRNGVTGAGQVNTDSTDTILAMPIDLLFDYAGVHLIAEKADDVDISVNFSFADTKQDWNMWVRRAVLNARSGRAPGAQLTLTGPKPLLAGILLQPGKASAILESGKVTSDGDVSTLTRLADIMDTFDPNFDIATP